MRRLASLLVGVLVFTSACSLNTLGAPTGSLQLTASFDDVAGLVPGHTVQTSNVVIGSVRKIELDGYRAKVTVSISDGHPIPTGTKAVIKRTSLLGEHYIDLQYPPGYDPNNATFLTSGTEIPETGADPELEDLAQHAGQLVTAVTSDDLSAVVQAGFEGIGGKGPQLNKLISQLSQVVGVLGGQNADVTATIDNLGRLGASLAPLSDSFGSLLDALDSTTVTLIEDRDKFFTTLDAFNQLAGTINDVILVPHADQFTTLLHEAQAVVASLNENRGVLESLADNFARFVPLIQKGISHGQLLVAVWGEIEDRGLLPDYLEPLVGS